MSTPVYYNLTIEIINFNGDYLRILTAIKITMENILEMLKDLQVDGCYKIKIIPTWEGEQNA